MNLREIIILFLFGVLMGVAISPFTNKTPQEAAFTPVTDLKAETTKTSTCIENETSPTTAPKVLGTTKIHFGDLVVVKEATPSQNITEVKKIIPSTFSGKITVAVFGDSMVDVMEDDLPFLKTELQKYYPLAILKLYNYGIGAQNIEQASKRIDKAFDYKDRYYPSLIDLKPDIIVLGSFSYNPFEASQDELYRHWANLALIKDIIKDKTKAKLVILAEIASNKAKFGQGLYGVNWTADFARQHAKKIQQYLENTINFANTYEIPLADAYHQSIETSGEGNLQYINPEDYIHQNIAGNVLMAQILAREIFELKIYE